VVHRPSSREQILLQDQYLQQGTANSKHLATGGLGHALLVTQSCSLASGKQVGDDLFRFDTCWF